MTSVRGSVSTPLGYNWLLLYRDDVHRVGGVVINGQVRPIPDMFKERDKFGLRHVMADRKSYAQSTFVDPDKIAARRAQLQYKENQRILKESL